MGANLVTIVRNFSIHTQDFTNNDDGSTLDGCVAGGTHRILRFEYAYVGLPALDGEPYATGENLLGVALSTLMRLPADRRAELYAEGLKRIAGSGENGRGARSE